MALTIVEVPRAVTGGVDTHLDMHVAAALDGIGGLLGVEEFSTARRLGRNTRGLADDHDQLTPRLRPTIGCRSGPRLLAVPRRRTLRASCSDGRPAPPTRNRRDRGGSGRAGSPSLKRFCARSVRGGAPSGRRRGPPPTSPRWESNPRHSHDEYDRFHPPASHHPCAGTQSPGSSLRSTQSLRDRLVSGVDPGNGRLRNPGTRSSHRWSRAMSAPRHAMTGSHSECDPHRPHDVASSPTGRVVSPLVATSMPSTQDRLASGVDPGGPGMRPAAPRPRQMPRRNPLRGPGYRATVR
jgi:hypothetical protein